MEKKKEEEAGNKIIGFRIPMHFAKAVEEQAKKIGVSVSEYITFCLIQDYRNNYVEKEVSEAVKKGSIYFSIYPTSETVKRVSLSEMSEQATKEVQEIVKRKTKKNIN